MTERIGLADINSAFDLLRTGRAGAAVIVF